jgi:flagellar biosynthesis/type III secretory pathway protein FliH
MGPAYMSGDFGNVIKSGVSAQIKPLFGTGAAAKPETEPVAVEAGKRSQLDMLEDQIAALKAEIAGHEAALKKAHEEGYEAGQEAAEAEFEDSREQALEKLTEGVETANADLQLALQSFESHALQLAAQALDTLIGEDGMHRQILAAMIAKQVSALGKTGILAVTVSRSDFPDSRELLQAAPELSGIETKITVDDDLPAGRCDITLLMGNAEIDLNRSWAEISEILSGDLDDASDTAS